MLNSYKATNLYQFGHNAEATNTGFSISWWTNFQVNVKSVLVRVKYCVGIVSQYSLHLNIQPRKNSGMALYKNSNLGKKFHSPML